MKRIHLILSLVFMLVLVSCDDTIDIPMENNGDMISFSVNNEYLFTRGTPLSTSAQMQNMTVYAYFTGTGTDNWTNSGTSATPNFMDNVTITNDGMETGTTNWNYSPSKYWPSNSDANISFFAYAPSATDSTSSLYNGINIKETTGGITISYEAPTECSNQPDLMLATPVLDLDKTYVGAIDFEMNHLLACIGFYAAGSYDTISTIRLTNIYTSGEVTYDFTTSKPVWTLGSAIGGTYNAIPKDTMIDETSKLVTANNGYLMMIPQTLPSNAEIYVETKRGVSETFKVDGQVWTAGQKTNYKMNLTVAPDDYTITVLENSFIGAFWKHNETGERIIRMDNEGGWEVFVLDTDDQWNESYILLDTLPSGYSKTIGTAITGNIQYIFRPKNIITGTGNINFRVGIRPNATLSTEDTDPRYAVLLLRHSDLKYNQYIFLRQGEKAAPINGDTEFSPYNIGTTSVISGRDTTYNLVSYPTQAGGFKIWSQNKTMYSPTGTVSWIIGNTDTISNICPKGYGIPSYSDFQALLSVSGQAYSSNCYGGLYADGYFDRAEITISSSGSYNTYTVGSGVNVAYNGFVVYNPSTYASLFFPMAGQRSDTGVLSNAGSNANYWTSTLGTYSGSDRPYYLFGSLQSDSNKTDVYINLGDINSVGKSIRPIAVEVTDTGTTGTLDGFTDESGWE